jgi:hypothetical protein
MSSEGKVLRFRMARPKIVRTKEEAAQVDPALPIQVELVLSPADRMHDALARLRRARKETIRLAENELALAEQQVRAKRQVVEQLRANA